MEVCMYEGYLRNRKQLCKELKIESNGKRKDTECSIILRGYQRWGRDVTEHLLGSFAFVIKDDDRQELFCARDQFGIESFYYCITSEKKLLYAGDLCSIVESDGFKKEIDKEALQQYMMFGYPVGAKTLYKGVMKLLPGHFIIFHDPP